MNKIFFKFASFDDFVFLRFHCLMCLLLMSCSVISLGILSLSLYEIHAVGLRHFFRFVCRDGTSQDIASIFFGRQRMTCPLFAYSLLYKAFCCLDISKPLPWMQSLVQRCFTPFQTNSRHQIYGNQVELIKNLPSILSVTVTQRRKLKSIWHSTETTYWL